MTIRLLTMISGSLLMAPQWVRRRGTLPAAA